MKRSVLFVGALLLACGVALAASGAQPRANRKVVRVAIPKGMQETGLWQEITRRFEAKTGYTVKVAVADERSDLAEAFREGKADLLTMHSGDGTSDLVADGFGLNVRAWARNGFVLLGPEADPAHVAGMKDGAAALKRIADSHSNYVDGAGMGARQMAKTLWKRAGIERPQGDWVLKDDSEEDEALVFAADHNAYVLHGIEALYLPDLLKPDMRLKIMVDGSGDSAMRRPYEVMEANPKKVTAVNAAGARALSNFLLSDEVQKLLRDFDQGQICGDQEGVRRVGQAHAVLPGTRRQIGESGS